MESNGSPEIPDMGGDIRHPWPPFGGPFLGSVMTKDRVHRVGHSPQGWPFFVFNKEINVTRQKLQTVTNFKYLGSVGV